MIRDRCIDGNIRTGIGSAIQTGEDDAVRNDVTVIVLVAVIDHCDILRFWTDFLLMNDHCHLDRGDRAVTPAVVDVRCVNRYISTGIRRHIKTGLDDTAWHIVTVAVGLAVISIFDIRARLIDRCPSGGRKVRRIVLDIGKDARQRESAAIGNGRTWLKAGRLPIDPH